MNKPMPKMPLAPRDAMVELMIMTAAVDRKMDDLELGHIRSMVETLPVFAGYSQDRLVETAKSCMAELRKSAPEAVLARVIDAIPPHLSETAYGFVCDIAAADLHLPAEELRFVQIIRGKLGIDRLIAAAIERASAARYKTA